ncbi:MAG: hypothetical protein HGA37_03400, partial [Lentimicrobium sp.]|nr:hypothetical protein [Lentimicrobium sp.]
MTIPIHQQLKITGRFTLFILLLSIPMAVSAQYYDIGQAPASIRWEKIETGNFSIIYPSSYYEKAKEVAFQFSSADTAVSSGLKSHPKHTPLILHPHSPISNAYAIWAPRRIELLTIPPQDLYPQPWIQQLALHEYRHIVQLSSLNQGFTKVLGYFLGQQAAAVSTGLFVPPWFLEGDAVVSETALSNSGRGRVASFSQPLRAQLAEKGAYSYPKASLGSYRDFVPDIYITGYHIVAASRQKYGPQLWTEAMNSVARQPWTITPFNYGLKKISGLNKKGLYLETVKKLDSIWSNEHSDSTNQVFLANDPAGFTNYLHPYRINDSTIIALKTSFRYTPKIISIDLSGNEKVIHNPGYIMNELVSYNGGYLAWAEYKPHIRWETGGFTEIVLLNPLNGSTERLKVKGKFYAPEVSPDGNYVAAVEYTDSGESFISITEIKSGATKRLELPAGIHSATPSWSRDGKNLVFIATNSQGKAIAEISADNGVIDYLTTFSFDEISNPAFNGNEIAYTGTYQENNQIFSFNPEKGQIRKLTDVNYGADQVSFRGDSLLIAEYTANGYRISVLPADRKSNEVITGKILNNWPLAEALSIQESQFRLTDTPDIEYKRIPYRKAANLFGLHSWAPLYIDIGGETARPGVSLMSQNLLSTMFVTAGYDYNMQEEAGMFRADVSWKGWFPVLKASAAKGNRASSYSVGENQPPQRFTWKETNLDLSVSQNLNLSRGPYNSGLFGETSYNYSRITHDIS